MDSYPKQLCGRLQDTLLAAIRRRRPGSGSAEPDQSRGTPFGRTRVEKVRCRRRRARVIGVVAVVAGLYPTVVLRAEAAPPSEQEEERIAALLSPAATGGVGGTTGFLVHEIDGDWPVLSRGDADPFAPVSSIKTLIAVHIVRKISMGTERLDAPLTVYRYPLNVGDPLVGTHPNICPGPLTVEENPLNAESTTVSDGLRRMLVDSDNRTTRAFVLRYGLAAINRTAADIGMTSTQLDQPFTGCPWFGHENMTTLRDLSILLSGVDRATLVSPQGRSTLYDHMLRGPWNPTSPFAAVVRDEAAAAGLGVDHPVISELLARAIVTLKGGNLQHDCLDPLLSTKRSRETCITAAPAGTVHTVSLTGIQQLPFVEGGRTVTRSFFFGNFIDNRSDTCIICGSRYFDRKVLVHAESFRTLVRASLESLVQAPRPDLP